MNRKQLNDWKSLKLCQQCRTNPERPAHTCPLAVEIYNRHSACNCCDECCEDCNDETT